MEGDGRQRDGLGLIKDECLCLRNHILADPALQVGLLVGDVRVRVDLTARTLARDTPCTQPHSRPKALTLTAWLQQYVTGVRLLLSHAQNQAQND